MNHLQNIIEKKSRMVIGLMSGTSLDAVDLALVQISGEGFDAQLKLIQFDSFAFEDALKKRVQQGFYGNAEELCRLNFDLGHFFADQILRFMEKHNLNPVDIDLIGSHGQTLYHHHGHSSLQLGEPDVIAQKTGIVTVADFRTADIAVGGSGAPLVPYLDQLMYHKEHKNIALQNMGGMGNVTFLPDDATPIIAFDTGPCNGILNEITEIITGSEQHFDEDAMLAKQGAVQPEILKTWLAHPYFAQDLPKSTGRELFGKHWAQKAFTDFPEVNQYDLLRTAVALVAHSIFESYQRFIPKVEKIFLAGGGAHNPLVVGDLQALFGKVTVGPTPQNPAFCGDSKEAVAFALFAHERLNGNPTSIPSVTGASKAVSMGKISFP